MISNDSFERIVSDWFHADAEHRVPDHLDAVLRRTSTERQRPAWPSLERWLSMDTTFNRRLAPIFRPAGPLIVAALLVLALVAVILVVGARQSRLPAPFGPAGNGAVAYGSLDGDIYTFNPATGLSTPLITGPTNDVSPLFRRDGSMFVFARWTTSGFRQLMLAKADGTVVRSLASPFTPPGEIDWSRTMDWSPDGSRLALIDSSLDTFSIVSVDGSPAVDLAIGMKAEDVRWRPNGQELVFKGVSSGPGPETYGLYVVRADGTDLREIALPTPSQIQDPALSPDGTQVMYTTWDGDAINGGHLYVVNVDNGNSRMLVFDEAFESAYSGEWSPDGSRIVFTQGTAQVSYRLAVRPAGGGQVVDIGPELLWNAGPIAVFSPDGSKVIARYSNGTTWIFDVAGGPGQRLEHATGEPLSWQRVAR